MKKKISILGSTGSVGLSTLSIIDKDKKNFQPFIFTANKNYKLICNQIKKYKPKIFLVTNFDTYLSPWQLNNICQLCRFLPNNYYNYIHCEQGGGKDEITRVFAWMIYLNNIDQGGETEFIDYSFKVKPTCQKVFVYITRYTSM